MNRNPLPWAEAHASEAPPVRRYVTRCALRLGTFVRQLAIADHHSFMTL